LCYVGYRLPVTCYRFIKAIILLFPAAYRYAAAVASHTSAACSFIVFLVTGYWLPVVKQFLPPRRGGVSKQFIPFVLLLTFRRYAADSQLTLLQCNLLTLKGFFATPFSATAEERTG